MKYILTTCSKDKDESKVLLPAIQRYTDNRVAYVYRISKKLSLPMIIFSGKYGILKTNDPIPFYDLRLEKEHVDAMVEKVAGQFHQLSVSKIDFYGLDEQTHTDWVPYYDVIREVCVQVGTELNIIHLKESEYATK